MEQTSTIRFIYAVFKLSFSKQYKVQRFNPLDQGFPNLLWPCTPSAFC